MPRACHDGTPCAWRACKWPRMRRNRNGALVALPPARVRYHWHIVSTLVFALVLPGTALPSGRHDENYVSPLGTVVITSPMTSQALHGTFNWTVSARRSRAKESISERFKDREKECIDEDLNPGVCGILFITFFLDGKLIDNLVTTTDASMHIDTTALSNGSHELLNSALTNAENLVGTVQRFITVDNGRVPMALKSGWSEIVLAPGQTQAMAPTLVYTNGDESPLATGVEYRIDNHNVAAVNSSGIVTAVSNGVATLTSTAQGKSATARIVVSTHAGFPHFSKDGEILTQYDPSRSLFLKEAFKLTPEEVRNTPSLGNAAQMAGINALEGSLYSDNPSAYDPDVNTFEKWRTRWQERWDQDVETAQSHGLGLFLIGDDVARFPYLLHNSITNPWVPNPLQYALSTAKRSGIVVAVDMVDEVSFLWGDTPTPTDNRWASTDPSIPSIPDNAFTTLMQIMNGGSGRPLISWPVDELFDPVTAPTAKNWMGNPAIADYASHYWDSLDLRDAYYYSGPSLGQIKRWMGDFTLYGRIPSIQLNKPQISLVGVSGPSYTKIVPGGTYTEGKDILGRPGHGPQQVMGQIMFAATTGMAGVRLYTYEPNYWKSERIDAPAGAALDTGLSVGDQAWNAMSQAFNFLTTIEPRLLQQKVSTVDLGSNIATTARAGANGKLLMAVNMSEAPQPITANLRPYRGPGVITRYRLTIAGLTTQAIPAKDSDSLILQPGETVTWIF